NPARESQSSSGSGQMSANLASLDVDLTVGQGVVDLAPCRSLAHTGNPNPGTGAGTQPVWIGQLESQATIRGQMSGGALQACPGKEDVGRHHHKLEAAIEAQVLDTRPNELQAGQPPAQMGQHH